MPGRVKGEGKRKPEQAGAGSLPAVLTAARAKAKSPELRGWLTAMASDRATASSSTDRTHAEKRG